MSRPSQDFSLERLAALHAASTERVWWRHDVDFSLECALRMAEFEAESGIVGSYFFLPRSPQYAVYAEQARELIQRVCDLGHLVGTHVDLGLPRDAPVQDWQLLHAASNDVALLRSHGLPVGNMISWHTPPRDALWREVRGYNCASAPVWEGHYVSDSRGVFTRNLEAALAKGERLQVNLHPEWWFLPAAERAELKRREAVAP